MRIPLRTLLAYLDDMLAPEEARRIGLLIAEDETARELMRRIKEVTRRRRLTTPPPSHPASAKMEPNTIAAYLDNTLPAEQQEEIEQICLTSDVHLAEVAACHQLLTMTQADAGQLPPTARQRMYGLVRGPEAVPSRSPTRPVRPGPAAGEENQEVDETLRLGLPRFQGKNWQNNLLLLGGVAAAVLLLAVAVLQITSLPRPPESEVLVAQMDSGDKTPSPSKGEKKASSDKTARPEPKVPGGQKPEKISPPQKEPAKPEPDKKEPEKKEPDKPEPDKKEPEKKEPDKKEPEKKEPATMVDVPAGPPSQEQVVLGNLLPAAAGDSSILVQFLAAKKEWQRLTPLKKAEVYSGRPLVSLPGCRSTLQLNNNLRLTLWGNVREQLPLPVMESKVELHKHLTLDLDMTLLRGRILLRRTQADRPVRVRVRFENPTLLDSQEFFDITMQDKGAEVLVDRLSSFQLGEPFYKDPKHANRLGPNAFMGVVVLGGSIRLKSNDVTFTMQAPPGPAMIFWDSRKGLTATQTVPKIPDGIVTAPPGLDVPSRTDILQARDDLATAMSTKPVYIVMAESLQSANAFRRIMAIRCLGAIDDLAPLVDVLGNEKNHDMRQDAIQTLRLWIAASRDHDYKMLESLQRVYKPSESEKIIELLHGLSNLELLVDYLVSPTLPMRELAIANLLMLRPDGQSIGYSPVADAASRDKACQAWRSLLKKPPPSQTK